VTPFLAYIPIIFPDEIEHYMSIAEIVSAVGYLLGKLNNYDRIGPLCGSILYGIGGYTLPFIVFGTLSAVISVFLFFFFNSFQ
jgi:hypothetical protein